MRSVVEFLRSVAGTGEVITVVYGAGSRPGEPRELVVLSCSETDLRAYEPAVHMEKQYKVAKILEVETSSGERIASEEAIQRFLAVLPRLETLPQYADLLRARLRQAGWVVHEEPDCLGVGTMFKNGKAKKSPSIAVRYFDPSTETVWELGARREIQVRRELTGRERPWRVDSWRFQMGKTFGALQQAVEVFLSEVDASEPTTAKSMFAGH
jgi:hypothetical protein